MIFSPRGEFARDRARPVARRALARRAWARAAARGARECDARAAPDARV